MAKLLEPFAGDHQRFLSQRGNQTPRFVDTEIIEGDRWSVAAGASVAVDEQLVVPPSCWGGTVRRLRFDYIVTGAEPFKINQNAILKLVRDNDVAAQEFTLSGKTVKSFSLTDYGTIYNQTGGDSGFCFLAAQAGIVIIDYDQLTTVEIPTPFYGHLRLTATIATAGSNGTISLVPSVEVLRRVV